MKRIAFILVCLLVFARPTVVNAQSDFFFNIYGGSTNLWSSMYLQLPANYINALIDQAIDGETDGYSGGALRYEIFKMKNDQGKIKVDNGSYWGFKSKDMFRNVQYGLKFGWQPQLSPFGIYISCAYQFNKFSALFDSNMDEWTKFKIHCVKPGIGIRITPFINMLENENWSPCIEVGTSYNYHFSCNAPYDSNMNQFNNGMTSTFAAGVRLEYLSITGGVELDHYSLFNQDFTVDNGVTYPYKGLETSNLTIFLSISHDF